MDKLSFFSVVEPSIDFLQLCGTNVPMSGNIYESTKCMLKRIHQVLEEQDPLLYGTIRDIIINSWNKCNNRLHSLACLEPKFL